MKLKTNVNVEKMLATHIMANGLLPVVYEELLQINKQEMHSPGQNQTKDMKR